MDCLYDLGYKVQGQKCHTTRYFMHSRIFAMGPIFNNYCLMQCFMSVIPTDLSDVDTKKCLAREHLTALQVCLGKRTLHLYSVFNEMFLPCRVTTFMGQKVVKHGGHQGISFLFID